MQKMSAKIFGMVPLGIAPTQYYVDGRLKTRQPDPIPAAMAIRTNADRLLTCIFSITRAR